MPIVEHLVDHESAERLGNEIKKYIEETKNTVLVIWGEGNKMKELYP